MTWGRWARASLNKRFLQLHEPTVKKKVQSCWPSLRLQSWAQLVREADSLLAELIIHFKVKCWLIIHPICSQERNVLQILLHLKTWLCANPSLAFRFASLVLEAERAKRGTCRKKMEGYFQARTLSPCDFTFSRHFGAQQSVRRSVTAAGENM